MTGLFKRHIRRHPPQPSWKAYQESLKRQYCRTPGRVRPVWGRWIAAGLVGLAVIGCITLFGNDEETDRRAVTSPPVPTLQRAELIQKADVHILLGKTRLINLEAQPVKVDFAGRPYRVDTSLDLGLQQYLLSHMDRVNSRYIGIVAMEADTGRLLAMAGFNKVNPDQDPCLIADYPAASLFKIITAAAAVEEKGYTAGSRFKFNGYKHTLYKRQLTTRTNRYTNSISLQDSFAQSVNPVFGKIGALYLDPQDLETYGDAFGFNRKVDFELSWATSRLTVQDEAYRRAEIASGFNRQTTISPLHGAMIVSTVVNGGKPVEPTLVERIVDASGKTVYQTRPCFLPAAVSPKTAAVVAQLMAATVTSGTASKVFRGYRHSKVLSRLKIGGKTGSIYNQTHDARYDWFVGYATEKKGSEKVVIAVMVAHEEYIGTRAGQYARMAIEHYFKDYFARKTQASENSNG